MASVPESVSSSPSPCAWCGKACKRAFVKAPPKRFCKVSCRRQYWNFVQDPPHGVTRTCTMCTASFVVVLGAGATRGDLTRKQCSEFCRDAAQRRKYIPWPHTKIVFCRCGSVSPTGNNKLSKRCAKCSKTLIDAGNRTRIMAKRLGIDRSNKEALELVRLGKFLRSRAKAKLREQGHHLPRKN